MVKEIHFVTGKGGVGKSLIAAALAYSKSQSGQRTLLVELGEQSYFSYFFNISKIGYEPTGLKDNLDIALWSGTESLKEYARYLLKVETLYKLFFENPVSRSLVNVAPALPELAVLGKITSDPRKHGPPMNYDVIVVDAFATGHFLSLLRGPRGMAQAVKFGPMGEQSRNIDEFLFRKDLCHYHAVTLPEELPVQETIELCETLKSEFGVSPQIILNKVIKTFLKSSDLNLSQKKNSNSDFIEFINTQLERLETSLKSLQKITTRPKMVGFFSENNPWALVEKIQRELQ